MKSKIKSQSLVFIENVLPLWNTEPAINAWHIDTYYTIEDMEAEW